MLLSRTIDVFLKYATHGEFLNRVTREDRNRPSLAHRFTDAQILETLLGYLSSADSPALVTAPTPAPALAPDGFQPVARPAYNRPFARGPNRAPAPRTAPVRSLDAIDDDPDDATADPALSDDAADVPLHAIAIPDNDFDRELYHIYCASIHQINRQPGIATAPSCIVCGESHRFEDCAILNNVAFLKSHYIRFCSNLKRDEAARLQTHPAQRGVPTRSVATELLAPAALHNSDDEDYDLVDFQTGRV